MSLLIGCFLSFWGNIYETRKPKWSIAVACDELGTSEEKKAAIFFYGRANRQIFFPVEEEEGKIWSPKQM